MRGILSGQRGLAPALLVVVVVWALAAVLMLTGTLVAANRIDDSVGVIKPEVNDIGTDTRAIELAARTARISDRIAVAAQPLTGELDSTLTAAKGIDVTAKSIIRRVGAINETAGAINGSVKEINGSVGTIGSSVDSIQSNVLSINRHARSIRASADGVLSSARQINSSVHGIQSSGRGISSEVASIDVGVAAINRRAGTIADVARPIAADLGNVLGMVGTSATNGRTIYGHANSIACSNLLRLTNLGDRGCVR
jgi:methyl-accepting chemotaxis protein